MLGDIGCVKYYQFLNWTLVGLFTPIKAEPDSQMAEDGH